MKNSSFTFYERTILENIDFEGYDLNNDVSRYDKIKTLYNIFVSEYCHKNNQHTAKVFLFRDWLQGLPSTLTVPFMNHMILENAKKDGYKLNSESKEDEFLDNYWMNLANAFFTLKDNL